MWRTGTPLDSRVVHGVTGHLSICMWNLWVFLDDSPGCHCPFVLCLDPQDCPRPAPSVSLPIYRSQGRPRSLCPSAACSSLLASPIPRATNHPQPLFCCWIRLSPPSRKPGKSRVVPFILTPGGEGKRSFPAHLRGPSTFSSSSSNAQELRVTDEDTRGSEC